MSSSINLTSDQLAQMDQLREYITDYCTQKGIDPNTYLSSLDGTIDVDMRNDPAFQAYWSITAMQLAYLLSGGSPEVSSDGEVIYDEAKIEAAYAASDQDFINNIIASDPELMALFVSQTQGADAGSSLLAAINLSETSTSAGIVTSTSSDIRYEGGDDASGDSGDGSDDSSYTDQQARDFIDKYVSGDGLDWVLSYEEGIKSAEGSILDYIAQIDQQVADLTELMNNGSMSAEEYSSQLDQVSADRQLYMGMLQQLESNMSNVMEMISKMYQQEVEMRMAVIQNMKPA